MGKMINKCREILKMDKEDLKSEMKRDKIKKHLSTIKIPDDASDNELRRIIFWADLTKKDMCSYMHIWLKYQDYYDENDKTCGASDKVKPK
jgi:hypothetical protein